MSVLKRILRVVPGPAVTYAQSWVSLFANTHFANPEWRIAAENDGVALGAIIMVGMAVVSSDEPSRFLKIASSVLLVITIVLLASCRYIYFLLGPPAEPGVHALNSTWWNEIWSMLYTAAIVFLIAAISIGVLSQGETGTAKLWLLVGGSILILLIAIVIYFLLLS